MSWQNDGVMLIRTQINDVDSSNYTYSDCRLEEVFLVSAYNIVTEMSFTTSYTVSLANQTITPDPSSDNFFIALTALKSSCLILWSEYKTAANSSVSVTDGPSTINYTNVSKELKAMYDHCFEQLQNAKWKYNMGEGALGHVILTPYSPGSDFYNYRSERCR